MTEDKNLLMTPSVKLRQSSDEKLPDVFYKSDTFKCIMKERETISFFKKVRNDIDTELNQRIAKCAELKRKIQQLADLEKRLLMTIDGVQVQNEMDLENLKYTLANTRSELDEISTAQKKTKQDRDSLKIALYKMESFHNSISSSDRVAGSWTDHSENKYDEHALAHDISGNSPKVFRSSNKRF